MSKITSINCLRKRLLFLATARVIEGKDDKKIASKYTETVAELAKRTRKPAKQIRTLARRRARAARSEHA